MESDRQSADDRLHATSYSVHNGLIFIHRGGVPLVRILVVDDDPYIRDLIGLYIRREGFELVEAADGLEALSCLEKLQVDLVVLDIMMPNMDGWEFCENVKSVYDIPIIMVTAKGEPQQRIKGFELGSDDYLVKPFEPRELIFRIKALLRRYQINSSHVIQIDDVTIDRRTYQVHMGQQSVVLPPRSLTCCSNWPAILGKFLRVVS